MRAAASFPALRLRDADSNSSFILRAELVEARKVDRPSAGLFMAIWESRFVAGCAESVATSRLFEPEPELPRDDKPENIGEAQPASSKIAVAESR